MKKVLVAISLLLAVCMTTPIVVGAEESDTLASHLVVHYDFEGDTLEEQLSDKATGGSSKENLELITTTDEATKALSYVSDGIAHIDSSAQNYMICTLSDTNDITALTTGMTVYLKIKVGSNNAKKTYLDFLNIDSTLRMYADPNSPGSAEVKISSRSGSKMFTDGQSYQDIAANRTRGDVLDVALTIIYDPSSKSIITEGLYSSDGGITYTSQGRRTRTLDSETTIFSDATLITLGKRYDKVETATTESFDFYDVRIYDKKLSQDELVSINYTPEEGGSDTDISDGATQETDPVTAPIQTEEQDTGSAQATESASAQDTDGGSDTEGKTSKGCGSSVGVTVLAGLMCPLALVTVIKKKRK